MASIDISRFLFQPEKRYSGMVHIQGSPTVDSDFTASQLIDNHGERIALAETICSKGSPNEGFRVSRQLPAGIDTYDLEFRGGSLYLGGIRLEANDVELLSVQGDWLQFLEDADLPSVPDRPRFDLVWIEAWEQCVSSIEDSETLDSAIGVESAARLRPMRRLHVSEGTSPDCNRAFDGLIGEQTAGGLAEFDRELCELRGTTRLVVGFEGGDDQDLCSPARSGGYLGCVNDTIRVQVTDNRRLVWSGSNASPLYRVQARPAEGEPPGSDLVRIEMLTPPWDQATRPGAGDMVEILRWGAALPNAEKVAEETGHLSVVTRSYDPNQRDFEIETPLPAAWQAWLGGPTGTALRNPRDPAAARSYFYMRVWRGESYEPGTLGLEFTPNAPTALGSTGLTVTLDGEGRPGDYWVFDVRANDPLTITPWAFTEPAGSPPTGPVRYLAPLALLRWNPALPTGPRLEIDDCRKRFRPLCRASGCCEVTVGDGTRSHGDVDSIRDALDLLPEEGGKICLLAGDHAERVRIQGRRGIVVEGCGPLSRLHVPASKGGPVIRIADSSAITLRNFSIDAPTETAVVVSSSVATAEGRSRVRDIRLEDLLIQSRDASAVNVEAATGFEMRRCRVEIAGLRREIDGNRPHGRQHAVLLLGDDLTVEDCEIRVDPDVPRVQRPMGGIHVLGDSERVRLRRNLIRDGNGNGIRLGSWRFVRRDLTEGESIEAAVAERRADSNVPWAEYESKASVDLGRRLGVYHPDFVISVNRTPDGCIEPGTEEPLPPDTDPDDFVVVVDGAIRDLVIEDQEILDSGLSGIGVSRYFDLDESGGDGGRAPRSPIVMAIEGCEIRRNRILSCMSLEVPELSPGLIVHSAWGGVTLAEVEGLRFEDNRIADCGRHARDPICGLFVLMAQEGARVAHNHIHGNGSRVRAGDDINPGRRGGIVFGLAVAPTTRVAGTKGQLGSRGAPALEVHENWVEQPEGQALRAITLGAVRATDNNLASLGSESLRRWWDTLLSANGGRLLNRSTVPGLTGEIDPRIVEAAEVDALEAILNLLGGVSVTLFDIRSGNPEQPPFPGITTAGLDTLELALPAAKGAPPISGGLMFTDNQVLLDTRGLPLTAAYCSVLLASASDVIAQGNQMRCDLGRDFVMSHLVVYSDRSARALGNRLEEAGGRVMLSASTLAPMNITTDNQGDHCFRVGGNAQTTVREHNFIPAGESTLLCGEINIRAVEDSGMYFERI